MTAAEAELLAAAVEQRRAFRALDGLPVHAPGETVSAWYARMGPVRERWEKALVRQQVAADAVLDELKRTPIGLFSDTQRGREALEIHADALRKAMGREVVMSWSFAAIGTVEKVCEALDADAAKQTGQCKVEMDAAVPHLKALMRENFNNNPQWSTPIVEITAKGSGSANDKEQNGTGTLHLKKPEAGVHE